MTNEYISRLIIQTVELNLPRVKDASPGLEAVQLLHQFIQNPKTIDTVYKTILKRLESTKYHPDVVSRSMRLLKSNIVKCTPSISTLKEVLGTLSQMYKLIHPSPSSDSIVFLTTLIIRILRRAEGKNSKQPNQKKSSSKKTLKKEQLSTNELLRQPSDRLPVDLIPNILRSIIGKSYQVHDMQFFKDPYEKMSMHIPYMEDLPYIDSVVQSKKEEERMIYHSTRKPRPLFRYKHYEVQSKLRLPPEMINVVLNSFSLPTETYHEVQLNASKILVKLLMDCYCEHHQNGSEMVASVLDDILYDLKDENIAVNTLNLIFNLSVHANLIKEYTNEEEFAKINNIQYDLFLHLNSVLRLFLRIKITSRSVWISAMNAVLYFITDNGKINMSMLKEMDPACFLCFFKYLDYMAEPVYRLLVIMFVNLLYKIPTLSLRDTENMSHHHNHHNHQHHHYLDTIDSITNDIYTKVDGLDSIIDLYKQHISEDVTENLFMLLFHYVVHQIKRVHEHKQVTEPNNTTTKNTVGNEDDVGVGDDVSPLVFTTEDLNNIIHVFILTDFPYELKRLFVYIPTDLLELRIDTNDVPNHDERFEVVMKLLKYTKIGNLLDCLTSENMKSKTNSTSSSPSRLSSSLPSSPSSPSSPPPSLIDHYPILKKMNHKLISLILYHFFSMIHSHMKVELEFKHLLSDVLEPKFAQRNYSALNQILHSNIPAVRRNAEYIVCRLRELPLQGVSASPYLVSIETLHSGLLSHQNVSVRRSYLSISERLILSMKYQIGIDAAILFMNQCLSKVVQFKEKNEQNLFYMLNIILSTIMVRSVETDETPKGIITADETREYQLLISGKLLLPFPLLNKIELKLFRYIFINLPHRFTSKMRLLVLYIIFHRCKSRQDFEMIGGTLFYKKLLSDKDPHVAFLASRLLIDTIQKEKPEEFKKILSILMSKAVESNDEKILSNPYLQIKTILDYKDL
eukprot:TRINITY_DN9671_c0_g1_i1.p1 TRINITY_DN9671_c0_g1~~TRINITY_DN9671_c0_g1_i1.p1  ORF type:complete len:966 (+),score=154.69 TRINITY_DN9671_c0_g1_i1:47-2944(+)